MPDPIEELKHLTPGVDVAPLPAAEVRRRGDRRRRRSNALATLGGVAAAAAIVVPLALAARGTDRSEPQPVGPGPSTASTAVPGQAWRQRIPAGFDLTALPAGATFSYAARDAGAVDRLRLCGTTVLDTGPGAAPPPVDSAGAVHREAGTASAAARTLALYRDAGTAARVLAAVEDGVRACPVQRQPPGAPLVHRVVDTGPDTGLPADDSVVFTQQSRMDARLYADLTVVQVARVGNAVYVATSSTSAGGPQVVDAEVRRLATQSAPVLAQLCALGPGC